MGLAWRGTLQLSTLPCSQLLLHVLFFVGGGVLCVCVCVCVWYWGLNSG
jgi:hypothetical protein